MTAEIDEDGVEIAEDDIVERLRFLSAMIQNCERLVWGSDSAAMDEAAAEIERLRARITPDFIAEVIRRVDGNNDIGAGALGDAIAAALIDKEAGE